MTLGYEQPLHIVAFDHRELVSRDLFRASEPLSAEVRAGISDTRVIFEAVCEAVAGGAPHRNAGVLVDERFGSDVARKAKACGLLLAMPVSAPVRPRFQFEFGAESASTSTR